MLKFKKDTPIIKLVGENASGGKTSRHLNVTDYVYYTKFEECV